MDLVILGNRALTHPAIKHSPKINEYIVNICSLIGRKMVFRCSKTKETKNEFGARHSNHFSTYI